MSKTKKSQSDSLTRLILSANVSLALCGYVVLIAFPALLTLLVIKMPFDIAAASKGTDWLMVTLQFGVIALCGWISVDLFRMRPKCPAGEPLTRDVCADLWLEVDRLCAAYRVSRVHRIVITPRFDIVLERTPRRGLPLFHTVTLSIGLPVLQAVSGDHLRVLLARKISQVPRPDNWPVAWIYQLRTTWLRYAKDYPNTASLGNMLMGLWFAWYAPLYVRLTRLAARECELDADVRTRRVFEARAVEEAITTYAIRKAFVENKFWPAYLQMAINHPEPPYSPFRRMEGMLSKELDADRAHRLLDGLLNARALSDTHFPTLGMRWRKMTRNRPRLPQPFATSAARSHLPDTVDQIEERIDWLWLGANIGDWRQRHARAKTDNARLDDLIEQLPKKLLSTKELWEYTELVEQYMGPEKAAALYKALLESAPRDPQIYYKIGRFLLECRDQAGVSTLERAMNMDGKYTTDACQAISEFMRYSGERRKARTYEQRATEYNAV